MYEEIGEVLTARGVVAGWAPTLDPAALGYPVTAFLTLQLRQGAGLAADPETLDISPKPCAAATDQLPVAIAFAVLGRVGPLLGLRPSEASAAGADQPS